MGWHKFGVQVDEPGYRGLAQFFGTVNDEEFEELTRCGLPQGWVAWHQYSCDEEALRKLPVIVEESESQRFRFQLRTHILQTESFPYGKKPELVKIIKYLEGWFDFSQVITTQCKAHLHIDCPRKEFPGQWPCNCECHSGKD
jgi:hypothetical protein